MKKNRLTEAEIANKCAELNVQGTGDWQIVDNKLSREFVFKDFQSAFDFMSQCAAHAEKINHHPEWCNIYNKVLVQLITHEVNGLTHLDFDLAAAMNQYALEG